MTTRVIKFLYLNKKQKNELNRAIRHIKLDSLCVKNVFFNLFMMRYFWIFRQNKHKKKFEKTQIFKLSKNGPKMYKSHLQEPKKPPKTSFSVFNKILDENLIWKKKFKKLTQKWLKMPKISDFWNFKIRFVAGNRRKSANEYHKRSSLSQILTRIFYIAQLQKFMKK